MRVATWYRDELQGDVIVGSQELDLMLILRYRAIILAATLLLLLILLHHHHHHHHHSSWMCRLLNQVSSWHGTTLSTKVKNRHRCSRYFPFPHASFIHHVSLPSSPMTCFSIKNFRQQPPRLPRVRQSLAERGEEPRSARSTGFSVPR